MKKECEHAGGEDDERGRKRREDGDKDNGRRRKRREDGDKDNGRGREDGDKDKGRRRKRREDAENHGSSTPAAAHGSPPAAAAAGGGAAAGDGDRWIERRDEILAAGFLVKEFERSAYFEVMKEAAQELRRLFNYNVSQDGLSFVPQLTRGI